MKRDLFLWQFSGFALTSLGGTLLHFVYDFTGGHVAAAIISGVNESTWEHMKLLFVPLFVFALVQARFFKEYAHFWCVKATGILTGLLLIPVLFYTLNGAFGTMPDAVNIAVFFVAAAVAFHLEAQCFKRAAPPHCRPPIAFGLLCAVGVLFVLFTFFTPHVPLFRDPLTGAYGL